MNINREDLERAADHGLVAKDKVTPLWEFLNKKNERAARFDFTTVAYYFGAAVVIIAMAWYLSLTWERSAGWSIALTAIIYALVFGIAGGRMRRPDREPTLGGLLIVVAVCMTPIFIYGIQKQLGLWNTHFPGDPPLDLTGILQDRDMWNSMVLQAATVAAAGIVLRFVRFPLLLLPMLVALWMLFTSPAQFTFVSADQWSVETASVVCGLVMIAGGVFLDRPGRNPYGFWFHLFGGVSIIIGMIERHDSSELAWLGLAIVSLLLIWFAILSRRRSHAAVGALGTWIYFMHLSNTLFKDSLWYPFVLTAFGLLVIGIGLWYRKRHESIDRTLLNITPGFLKKLLNY